MRQHAISSLNCDQRYIENRGNGESGSERCRRVAMVVTVVMAAMVVMMMTVALLVRLMRRHVLFDSRSPAPMLEHFRVGEQRAPDTWSGRIM
jgi:hypothetical protein